MRYVLKFALLFLCLLAALPGHAAKANDNYSNTVLVSPDQGEALAVFALQSEKRMRPKPDCSHLVHLLYARAGLIYPYQDSRVLYRGISDFQRVKTPQPGDLVVWLGHVGIVLSPEEKTFISSVYSGILTESWKAPHWVRRGRPRFYRYRIGPDTNMNLLSKIMDSESGGQFEARNIPGRDVNVPLLSPTVPSATDSQSGSARQQSSDLSPQEARSMDESNHGPASIVATITQQQIPSKSQIAAAIIEGCKTHARRLIDGETLDVMRPFTVFSRLEVEKTKIKHEDGRIILRLSETMSQEDGRICHQGPRNANFQLFAGRMAFGLSQTHRNEPIWLRSRP